MIRVLLIATISCGPPPTRPSTGPTGGAPSSPDQTWHDVNEALANGRLGPGADPTSTTLSANKSLHGDITAKWGHPIAIKFDWDSFKYADWVGVDIGAGRRLEIDSLSSSCTQDVLDTLASLCGDAQKRTLVSPLQSVTCHAKPCDQLPRSSTVEHDISPGLVYAYSADRTNIDKTFCQTSAIWTGPEGDSMPVFFKHAP